MRVTLGEHQLADAQVRHAEAIAHFDNDGKVDVRLINDRLSEAIDLSTRGDVQDDEFVRRVYFDLVGTPPAADEITQFAVDHGRGQVLRAGRSPLCLWATQPNG